MERMVSGFAMRLPSPYHPMRDLEMQGGCQWELLDPPIVTAPEILRAVLCYHSNHDEGG
jgi:hypothetical protein